MLLRKILKKIKHQTSNTRQESRAGQVGLREVLQKRRNSRAPKILITIEEVLEPGERTASKFYPTEQAGSKEQVKLIMGLALEQGILEQDYCSWDEKVKVQAEGAPIGFSLELWARW